MPEAPSFVLWFLSEAGWGVFTLDAHCTTAQLHTGAQLHTKYKVLALAMSNELQYSTAQ